jgi:hypothetical protein
MRHNSVSYSDENPWKIKPDQSPLNTINLPPICVRSLVKPDTRTSGDKK